MTDIEAIERAVAEDRKALAEAVLGTPRRIVNEDRGWDFWVRACRACLGDFPHQGSLPNAYANRGHYPECWFMRLIGGTE